MMKKGLLSIMFMITTAWAFQGDMRDASIVDSSIRLTWTSTGLEIQEWDIRTDIQSYKAMDHEGDPRIRFLPERQTLEVLRAETRMVSGKIVQTEANGFNLSTPHELVSCPPCAKWQEMVITFVGLEPGARTYLKYSLSDRVPFRHRLDRLIKLGGFAAVENMRLELNFPEGVKTRILMKEVSSTKEEITEDGFRRIRFTVPHIPSLSARELPSCPHVPSLIMSTYADWTEVGEYVMDMFEGSIQDIPGLPDCLDKLEIPEERIRRTCDYVADHYVRIGLDLIESIPIRRTAREVALSGEGSELELACLLYGYLRSYGMDVSPYLVSERPVENEIPGLAQFERIYLGIRTEDEMIFLRPGYPVREENISTLNGMTIYQPSMEGPELFRPADSRIHVEGNLDLNNDNLSVHGTIVLEGRYSPGSSGMNVDGLKSHILSFLPICEEITSLDPTSLKPLKSQFQFECSLKTESRRIILLPSLSSLEISPMSDPTRLLPLAVFPADISYRWTFSGHGTEPDWFLPKSGGKSGEDADLSVVLSEGNHGADYRAHMVIKKNIINPDHYERARNILALWETDPYRSLLMP